jgi:membrane protease YdiL (CAAX protease family)
MISMEKSDKYNYAKYCVAFILLSSFCFGLWHESISAGAFILFTWLAFIFGFDL